MNKAINIFKIIPIYVLKHPFGVKTYLHGLLPVIGIGTIAFQRKIERDLLPFLALFLLSMIYGVVVQDWAGVARCVQTILMVGVAQFFSSYFSDKEILLMMRNLVYMSFIVFGVELIINKGIPFKTTSLGKVPAFLGIIGEPNYSALALFAANLFFLYKKDYKFFLISLIPIVFSGSRTTWVCLSFGIIIFFQEIMPKNTSRWVLRLFLLGILSYPLLLGIMELVLDNNMKIALNKLTSERYAIHQVYLAMGLDNPFGVGYYRGADFFLKYGESFSLVKSGLYKFSFSQYQHNLFLQVFSEQGFWGYALLCFFFWRLVEKCIIFSIRLGFCFVLLLLAMTQLNAFSEFVLYAFIGNILSLERAA